MAFFCIAAPSYFSFSGVRALPQKKSSEGSVFWKEDFKYSASDLKKGLPGNWVLKSKPGTRKAVFSLVPGAEGGAGYMHMEADKASGTVITQAKGVDLSTSPVLKWRWRVTALPEGADGRLKEKDDQAIGLYVGSGGISGNKSVSYRWDTVTPKGSEGNASYGMGAVKVKWFTLRNSEDPQGEWLIEERNVAEDFKNAWGYYPDKVYVSVSCNSQYTGTRSAADLEWIEFSGGVLPEVEERPKPGIVDRVKDSLRSFSDAIRKKVKGLNNKK